MANGLLLPQIAALLGNPQALAQMQGGAAPSPVPGAVPPSPQPDPGQDITVTGSPIAPSRFKDRQGLLANIFPKAFATGSTGGNILGAFKDAFLTQAGRDPIYAPKLLQQRESEALENYNTDPTGALDKLMMVDPGAAMKGYNTYYDNQRLNTAAGERTRASDMDYEGAVRGRIGSMLYASNAKTYPTMLARARAYAQSKGVDVGDLPETFEDAQRWALGDVPVGTQVQLQDMRDYRTATNNIRATNAANRNAYNQGRLAQSAQTDAWRKSQGQARTDATVSGAASRAEMAAKAPDRSKWTQPVGRGGGSVAPGSAKKFVWDPTKGKYVAQ